MTEAINPPEANSVSQSDYLKLFMQELTYQDPLKPVDNKEFMAQMAQFSLLKEAQQTNEYFQMMIGMNAASQALGLLGKTVKVKNSFDEAKVINVTFKDKGPPELTLYIKGGKPQHIILDDITEVLE